MPNTAFAGFALCVLALTAASATARDWDGFTPRDPSLKQPGHWEWAWDGSDSLGIGLVGATVHYVPNGPARVVIAGPDEGLERVRVGRGQTRWCEESIAIKGLDVTVSGVTLHHVALSGADDT